jgi:hypothetical protein
VGAGLLDHLRGGLAVADEVRIRFRAGPKEGTS